MMLFAFAMIGMIALVLCVVFLGIGGSPRKQMKNRMEARAARLDYIRLAREADEARRARVQGEGGKAACDEALQSPSDRDGDAARG